jgi:hypothetical protein
MSGYLNKILSRIGKVVTIADKPGSTTSQVIEVYTPPAGQKDTQTFHCMI